MQASTHRVKEQQQQHQQSQARGQHKLFSRCCGLACGAIGAGPYPGGKQLSVRGVVQCVVQDSGCALEKVMLTAPATTTAIASTTTVVTATATAAATPTLAAEAILWPGLALQQEIR